MDSVPAIDFTKYLLKKDILMSYLVTFNEQPENYLSWKTTFKSVVSEIAASPLEEMDLLIKTLGVNSRKQAISLNSAYVHEPEEGLTKI